MTDNEALDKFQQMVGCPHDDMVYQHCMICGEAKSDPAPDVRTLWGAMVAARPALNGMVRFTASGEINMVAYAGHDKLAFTGTYTSEHAACAAIARAVVEYKEKGE